ncbi:pantetheine-phosphate adenylyltransferase [bacterium (Candidatus Blackallbacteria) CG17_big_fil_post_rev_8_21_14_2_50_48_46]|uniref:Phosphopantetheine adenylyltransferase n=1 Tax=bacterium (Candidatus Blackallbacteria) CG17_big_fil_post_rev_8_21_14_2_50_48_46 TaxID=2014261 RepID=A0A2M7FY46_9BACT|nr:MAG: pantetheine-phosphate adenylyltransferase [bacterium (Candidatus Blackallbacteria) CG18_big_fil_WC_8_21_14_2_50_49_26]PIW14039.1 MAG: pantetheine-phosphate adenylyltransferase [bacterium (Candidatus Blackallbacteria) CG17_big_fil_post_rev_8_21_14_2_50_48_46]PIW50741.1 MAG: pantetheine-phosphate adenylyltransferase [bacterium (Candidatus Blackallbacteria) CG13_big_fil_rev_8_21_14_2_50_49_14]
MTRAIYPGSFDPVTNGHLDIMERAAHLFDEVIVAVSTNIAKKCTFSVEERQEMIRQSTQHLPNLKIDGCDGLIVDYARQVQGNVIIRGLRAVSDFEIELKMALMNKHLNPEVDTVFLMPKAEYMFLNSSLIREIAGFGGNISDFVSPCVEELLRKKYNSIK